MSREGQRLDPRQVHAVERQYGKHMGKRTWSMRQGKAHRRLVHLDLVHFKFIVKHQESGEILLICLYAFSQYFKPIHIRSENRSDCTDAHQALLGDICGTFSRIFRLHQTDPRAVLEELTGLVYRHVMRPDFLYILYLLAGKSHEILLDPQEYLSLYLTVISAQKFEVRKKTSRNSVFYGHDSGIRSTGIHASVQIVERQTFYNFRHDVPVLPVEKPCRLLMKASLDSLNSYLFHSA